jgi:hypothetical protein
MDPVDAVSEPSVSARIMIKDMPAVSLRFKEHVPRQRKLEATSSRSRSIGLRKRRKR